MPFGKVRISLHLLEPTGAFIDQRSSRSDNDSVMLPNVDSSV